MARDENDRLNDGTLPDGPADDAKVVSEDVPRVLTVRDITRAAVLRSKTSRKRRGCTTGVHRLDLITGGLKRGFGWVIGAETSWGKSSLLVMITDENIRAGKRVLIVSAEDSEEIYGDRLMLRRSRVSEDRRVSADNLRYGKLTPEERAALDRVGEEAEDLPVFLDARGKSVEWLAPRIKRLIIEHRIDIVAFDYLQAFDNQKPQQDRRNQLTYIARVLTDITKTAVPGGIAGIMFSQITDDEKKTHPTKNSIRDSRDVSNAGEVVLLGFSPTKPIESEKYGVIAAGSKVLFADKVKDGPRGALIPLEWDENAACFDAIEDPEEAATRALSDQLSDQFDDYADRAFP
jgi:replicative DNA helicase